MLRFPPTSRSARRAIEEQWKEKLNANTVAIIAGSPEDTYLDITHDLAVVLNDEKPAHSSRRRDGGRAEHSRRAVSEGIDIGITSSQMLRYSHRPASSAPRSTSG